MTVDELIAELETQRKAGRGNSPVKLNLGGYAIGALGSVRHCSTGDTDPNADEVILESQGVAPYPNGGAMDWLTGSYRTKG